MCSGCSNDDPRPEMMGGFATFSPENHIGFAYREDGRRRHYRTLPFMRKVGIPAFLQRHLWPGGVGIRQEAYKIVHLRNRDIHGPAFLTYDGTSGAGDSVHRDVGNSGDSRVSCELIEIRVTAEAIIEVHGDCRCGQVASLVRGAARTGDIMTPRATTNRRVTTQAVFAYALFGAAAACVIWILLR
jgi:hypothetical protein